MKWFYILIVLQGLVNVVFAQNIDGTWIGNFPGNAFANDTKELVVKLKTNKKGQITGSSYLDYGNGYYEYYRIIGTYYPDNKELYLREFLTVSVNLPKNTVNRLGNYRITLKTEDNEERFEGYWTDNNPNDFNAISKSKVYFRRGIPRSAQPEVAPANVPTPLPKNNPVIVTPQKTPPKTVPLPDATLSKKASDTLKKETISKSLPKDRIIDVQKKVYIPFAERDSIKIEIMDNADEDGDAVSVYLNDSLVINNQIISEKPIPFYFSLTAQTPVVKIKMKAESEGLVPPCSAFLKVYTKSKELGINLNSDLQTDGTVAFYLVQ